MIVEPGDDARAAERIVALITKYAVRFDPVDRITFCLGIVRSIQADLAAQLPLYISCVLGRKWFIINSILFVDVFRFLFAYR
jgi:hypothetical protein